MVSAAMVHTPMPFVNDQSIPDLSLKLIFGIPTQPLCSLFHDHFIKIPLRYSTVVMIVQKVKGNSLRIAGRGRSGSQELGR